MSASIAQRPARLLPPVEPAADTNLHAALVVCLPRTRRQAVTIDRLAQLLRTPRRDIEQALQDLADSGLYPLCASSQAPMGVWFGTRAEVREYLIRHDSRIRSMLRRRHGLRRWLTTPEPRPVQVELWEVAP